MRKLILIAHISLDGFVASLKGDLDGFDASEENLRFVCSLTENADAALFGRLSYKMINNYWPLANKLPNATKGQVDFSNWYNGAQKIVFSKTLKEDGLHNTTIISSNIANEITKIKNEPGKDILIFGSPAVTQTLMPLNLIDSYWIFINPVLFGEGIPLFTVSKEKVKLTLGETQQFVNGELAMHYTVSRK